MSEPVPVAVKLIDGFIACRTVIPASQWDDPRRRDATWDGMRGECEAEAARQAVTFSGPEARVSQYIRLFREDGELKCDMGATEWTATDVWLELTVKADL